MIPRALNAPLSWIGERSQEVGVASDEARAGLATPQARSGLGHSETIANAATPDMLAASTSEREGPATFPAPTTLHCAGCKHLTTKYWKDYLDNDETDSGTSARCAAVPDKYGGKSITAYWSKTDRAPSWCPFLPTQDRPA